MKAVVLVGGEGTRLRPLTLTTPKPLLPIANQPFLERQLAWLADARRRRGRALDGLSARRVPRALRPTTSRPRRVRRRHLRYAVEDEPLGTAGAIRFAADGIDERFVVCNGDVLTDLDLGAMVRSTTSTARRRRSRSPQVDDPSAFGVVPTRADGEVIAFVEKPPPGKAPSNWINAGTYVLEPAFLDRIPPRAQRVDRAGDLPAHASRAAARCTGSGADGYWLDIGTPEQVPRGPRRRARGPARRARRRPVRVRPRPACGCRATRRSSPSAELVAPVLIGAGAHIEAGARVHASVVGAGHRGREPARSSTRGAARRRAVSQRRARARFGRRSATRCSKPDVALDRPTRSSARASRSRRVRVSRPVGRVPIRRGSTARRA